MVGVPGGRPGCSTYRFTGRSIVIRKVWLPAALSLILGCSASKVYIAPTYGVTGKVAVLPMVNNSNDLDGPVFLRELLTDGLAGRGFNLLPNAALDEQLKEKGFTGGGQLRATTPQKLGEWTGADVLFYSTVENFDYINVGFYAQRRVKVSARLVDAKTGERLWEADREGSTRLFANNQKNAEILFAEQLAIKAVEKMTHKPLQLESRMAVGRLLNTLPNR